jgi:Na+-transporting NADH:ubiquinone oxidoreductase subunit NqrD
MCITITVVTAMSSYVVKVIRGGHHHQIVMQVVLQLVEDVQGEWPVLSYML